MFKLAAGETTTIEVKGRLFYLIIFVIGRFVVSLVLRAAKITMLIFHQLQQTPTANRPIKARSGVPKAREKRRLLERKSGAKCSKQLSRAL